MNETRPEPEPVSVGLMLRLFLVPLAVVTVSVLVFLLFGLVASDRKTAADYINEIRSGTESRRWQAAYELANWLASRSADELAMENPVPDLIGLYRDTAAGDPRIRRYLVLAFGRLKDPAAVDLLIEALNQDDSQTVIYAAWSLGNIGAGEAVPALVRLLEDDDAGIRMMAAYTLGALGDAGAAPALRDRLADSDIDVVWNAALALGRLRDPSGLEVLDRMTRRDYLARFLGADTARQDEIIINTVRVLAGFDAPEIRSRLQDLSREDPSTRVRSAALDGLAGVVGADPQPPDGPSTP